MRNYEPVCILSFLLPLRLYLLVLLSLGVRSSEAGLAGSLSLWLRSRGPYATGSLYPVFLVCLLFVLLPVLVSVPVA
jgi:hypothetical protein